MMIVLYIAIPLSTLIAGCLIGYLVVRKRVNAETESLMKEMEGKIREKEEAVEALKAGLQQALNHERAKIRGELENELHSERSELKTWNRRLRNREDNLEKRVELLSRKEGNVERIQKELQKREGQLEEMEGKLQILTQEIQRRLEKVSGMTVMEAKQKLIESIEAEARMEAEKRMQEMEGEIREFADRKGKEVIATAIQRYAGEVISDMTISVINLPNDEMKGRIIGREGRNIKSLEQVTGVDIIIDDTPEAVVLSCFDPVRREIARKSLELLISDGRIHPARIEELVRKSEKEVNETIRLAGEQIALEVGVHGLHPELIRYLGRLKLRMSYGQNQYQHSMEVAFLSGLMAGELGLSVKKAKRAGLLHDIGKAVDHEVEGSHAIIGADLARKHGEGPLVVNAIAAHHEEEKPESPIAVLVQAADALSGARPGARREIYEAYLKRIHDLEKMCTSFKDVQKAYAIQAGREVRVIVNSTSVTDDGAALLAKEIAKKVEEDITYPGKVKVTVIREVRAVEYAK